MTRASLTKILSVKDGLTFTWNVDGLDGPVYSHHSTRYQHTADTRLQSLSCSHGFPLHDPTDTDENIFDHYMRYALGAVVTVTQLLPATHTYIDWR